MSEIPSPAETDKRAVEAALQNAWVIEQFRANDGKLPGGIGPVLLLLHHRGARTGTERISPMTYRLDDEGRHVIFASYAGARSHPAWYTNILANPRVAYEVGTETIKATARVAHGAERDRLWSAQKSEFEGFAEYERNAAPRAIPVVVLERVLDETNAAR